MKEVKSIIGIKNRVFRAPTEISMQDDRESLSKTMDYSEYINQEIYHYGKLNVWESPTFFTSAYSIKSSEKEICGISECIHDAIPISKFGRGGGDFL